MNAFKGIVNGTILGLILWAIILLCFGCASVQDNIQRGRYEVIHGFNQLERVDREYVFEIPAITIHVCPNNSYFPDVYFKSTKVSKSGIWGCANDKTIWTHGAMDNGKIVLEPFNLGHELWHVIEFKYKELWNPDEWMKGEK